MPGKRNKGHQVPDMMQAVRQKEAGGKLELDSIPVPEPGPGEVLIRMHAAPINPSDLAVLSGNYLTRPYPFTPGLEGSGLVVRSGGGLLPGMRSGKRVACTPNPGQDGTWAEYMKTSAMRSVPLPGSVGYKQGAMMLVNPMTAMAFIHMAKNGKHPAMVNNAAASALGKMLVRLCNRYSIPLINIVRKQDQTTDLKNMGASFVLNSSEENFEEDLKRLSGDLNATLFLDAVTGDLANILLRAAPRGTTLVTYARLSGDPVYLDPGMLIKEEKQVIGFQLGNWLQTKSLPFKLRFTGTVKKQLTDSLTTRINRSMDLEQVQEAIDLYIENMSAGKVVLVTGQERKGN
ncbi:MAG: zinc-binding dehydrogenase [Bacteroidales bacterium]|nr:zinc-binding dehydrogenase [Bacteroidales bacterium]